MSQNLTTDGYTIKVTNGRAKGLPPLIESNGSLTDLGYQVIVLLENEGYQVVIESEEE